MKGFISLLLFLSYSLNVNAQFIERSAVVKVETTLMVDGTLVIEHGTGNIIGSLDGYLYMLTAAHVVFPLDEDREVIDSKPTVKVIINSKIDGVTNFISFDAKILAKDHDLDILIAKIPVPNLSGNADVPLEYGFFGFIRGLDTLSESASLYPNMSITGFSGAAAKETETINGRLYTRTLTNDDKYFVMKDIPAVPGFSGSLVQWLDNQVLGMLLTKMDVDQVKIIRMETINKFLKENHIPNNLLKNHLLIGRWQCDSIVLPGEPIRTLKSDKKMVFKSDGTVEGLGDGTFCFIPEGIELKTKDFLEDTPVGSAFTYILLLSMDAGRFKVDDPSDPNMFNFSGPNPLKRRLSNSTYSIYLTKIE